MEELQVVRSERDRAVAEQRTLQLSISSLEQEKQVTGYMYVGWSGKDES